MLNEEVLPSSCENIYYLNYYYSVHAVFPGQPDSQGGRDRLRSCLWHWHLCYSGAGGASREYSRADPYSNCSVAPSYHILLHIDDY